MVAAVFDQGLVVMAALAFPSRAAILGPAVVVALALAGVARAGDADPHVAVKAQCLNAADTRELVKARKLIEPYAALKSAAQQRKAEALSAKLCVNGDDTVYEITLLHRDGRLIHVEVDAGTGKLVAHPGREPKDAHEAHDQPARN